MIVFFFFRYIIMMYFTNMATSQNEKFLIKLILKDNAPTVDYGYGCTSAIWFINHKENFHGEFYY